MKVHEIISEQQLLEKGAVSTGISWLKNLWKGGGRAAEKEIAKDAAKGAAKKEIAKDVAKGGAVTSKQELQAMSSSMSRMSYQAFLSRFGGFKGLAIKLITADALKDFYNEYKVVASQKERYDAGDKTTELFKDLSTEEAKNVYNKQVDMIVGKAVLIAAPQLRAPDKIEPFIKWILAGGVAAAGGAFGFLYGGVKGAAAGAASGSMLGYSSLGIIGVISSIMSKGITGIAYVSFINSEFGQKFLEEMLHGELLTIVGGNARKAYEQAKYWLNAFVNGTKGKGVNGEPKQDTSTQPTDQPTAVAPKTPEQLQIEKDFPSWPMEIKFKGKEVLVNGRPITDEEGNTYLTQGDLKYYLRLANSVGKEFPMQLVQKTWRGIQ